MLSFAEIKKQYPLTLHNFERGLLREYLQYIILAAIFTHPSSNKLSFLGGTALRLVYGIQRFSEDLDFDNKGLKHSEFEEIATHVSNSLRKEGFLIEITMIEKQAFHCHIKFPEILFQQGLSPLQGEKLKIAVYTFDQEVNYKPEVRIIDRFEVYKSILVTPKSVILAQKLWTITQRKKAKGRDYFDIMSLAPTTAPDMNFLQAKFGSDNWDQVRAEIKKTITSLNFENLARDVAPFLVRAEDAERIKLFPEYLDQLDWNTDAV